MSSAASTSAIAGHRWNKDPGDWKDKLIALGILTVIVLVITGLVLLLA